ncbi:MAG: hypothetical protein QOD65_902 [Gaiellales bacterium]|jgi:hypothetical protein|nr:hypothetical protein [Gaiellales bacterium]
MAKRWVIGGLAVGMGALVLAPEARTWLRRRLGLEPEDRRWFEEEGVETAEHEGDEPLDTREARFSLRARLAEEGHAEPEDAPPPAPPEPSPFPAFAPEPAPPAFPAFEQPASAPLPAHEVPAAEEPPAEEPAAAAEPAPRPIWPSAAPDLPPAPAGAPSLVPDPDAGSYDALPAITPEADEPRAPGEDTNEIDPLPEPGAAEASADQADGEDEDEEAPPPPPTVLRPPTSPASPTQRPFSSEGSSFRSAIDAARERVHGAAREATPDDEGESTEPLEDRS